MELSILGKKIKSERKQQNITLEILAEHTGISRNFLWEIEAGRKAPALKTLYNISVVLNVSIDYLMGVSDNKFINAEKGLNEYDIYKSKIHEKLNSYNINELKFICNILDEFTSYNKNSRS